MDFYCRDNANVHRGVHALSQRATERYERVRGKVARFLNAAEEREVVFVRGTTEAINLVARSLVHPALGPDDEIVVSAMEHHSNIVPWQMLCGETGARLRVIPMSDRGELILDDIDGLLGTRTKMVSLVHVSNALGTVNPVRRVVDAAHARGIPVLIDGAQAAPHLKIDVQELGCDFYTVSGHKMFGPTGAGALWGRAELLQGMRPYQGGGDMIETVTFEGSTYAPIPSRFEAGTPNIAGVIGLGAAVDYLTNLPWSEVETYERGLLEYAVARLESIPGLTLIGRPAERAGVVSFVLDGIHAHDLGTIVDQEGVAIRTGHHCAQPVMDFFGVPATARASFAFYNTRREVDALVDALGRAREVFG